MVHGAEAMKLDGGDNDHYNDMDVDVAPSLSCSATRLRFILKHVHDTMFLSLVFFCFFLILSPIHINCLKLKYL
jgi:hypothetical protein